MARGRKVSTESLDAKIEQQKTALEKAKIKYESEKETLTELIKLRNEIRKDELMDAEITAEKDEYIKEKKEQFRLVDMRKQYADIIAEAEQEKIEKYEIKKPTCVFNRMCKKPVLAYDKEQGCFFAELDAVKPEDYL